MNTLWDEDMAIKIAEYVQSYIDTGELDSVDIVYNSFDAYKMFCKSEQGKAAKVYFAETVDANSRGAIGKCYNLVSIAYCGCPYQIDEKQAAWNKEFIDFVKNVLFFLAADEASLLDKKWWAKHYE